MKSDGYYDEIEEKKKTQPSQLQHTRDLSKSLKKARDLSMSQKKAKTKNERTKTGLRWHTEHKDDTRKNETQQERKTET
jgi:hypothetical protein